MVNNAGVPFSGLFEETTDAHWDLALAVNVRGVIDGARVADNQMVTQPDGEGVPGSPPHPAVGRQAAPGGVQAPRLGTSGPRC